jgi:hypothetical protein
MSLLDASPVGIVRISIKGEPSVGLLDWGEQLTEDRTRRIATAHAARIWLRGRATGVTGKQLSSPRVKKNRSEDRQPAHRRHGSSHRIKGSGRTAEGPRRRADKPADSKTRGPRSLLSQQGHLQRVDQDLQDY